MTINNLALAAQLRIARIHLGGNIAQLHALLFIGHKDDCRIGELTAELGISEAAITGTIERLVRRGLVIRNNGSSDRRTVWLRLTESGRNVLAKVHDAGLCASPH